ncbi:abortive infection family protein [Chitinophaga sp. sic0106]|uniref:abortive infection family protein n=1 Tax=Chitinophaga sp. sic0106 TaxID=2854785 RepID=UPI001C47AFB8|nr:abortive infection family protein [Chitinophaga sp. sic0106]MBV7532853.1 abortive infection family protein [Chitinophaga sp. sic0106]
MAANLITKETRRKIADSLILGGYSYHGRLTEADFLARLYDLQSMASTDTRREYNTAYKDIRQHADNNPGDWAEDWVFNDDRFNLMYCRDEEFLAFLIESINPSAKQDPENIPKLLEIYNRLLHGDGFHLYQADNIKGLPIYNWERNDKTQSQLAAKTVVIKERLNTAYVNRKIEQMNSAIATDTDVAIGTGKELLEIVCKSIMKQKGAEIDKDWSLPKLLKETTNVLDFKPKDAANPEAAERSIKQLLGGISSIVQGVTELRNSYGSGHGKDADFKGLDPMFARIFVGVVAEISGFYLSANGDAELVES